MKLFTLIPKNQLLNGDVVKIDFINTRKSISKFNYGQIVEFSERTEHAIYKNGKFYSVIDNNELILENLVKFSSDCCKKIEYYLHNYKFIAHEETWYISGTEVYPDIENYGSEEDGCSLFQGLTYKENFNEMEGTGPCWDGETCSFDEFIITERINQKRHRKLLRLLK
jgi:hypothetical protein